MISGGTPTTAHDLLTTVNELRTTVVSAHNAMFKFRIRNLFKPIDFGRHYSLLESATNAVEELEVGVRQKQQHWKSELGEQGFVLVLSYLSHLKEASAKLRNMTGNLEDKSQGKPYPHRQYRADLSGYRRSAEAYAALGLDMNDLFHQLG